MTLSQVRIGAMMLVLGYLGSFWWFFPTFSADLMALWLAGKFLAMGQPDQVYAAASDYFLMYPPAEWRPWMAANYDYTGPIYPFLYPPIWAKLASLIAGTSFWIVTVWALVINAGLQMLTVWLAWRAAQPRQVGAALFMGVALLFLLATQVGTTALQQNQPQILVSFLLVLTIERARLGGHVAAGIALALAASIKLYPAIFAIYWLATGNRRAIAAFVVAGAALALVSLAWVGWPLHQQFLEQIRLIAGSVMVTAISFNLDSAIAHLVFMDALNWVPGLEPPTAATPDPGWYSMARPPLWGMLSTAALLAAFAATVVAFRRADHDTRHAVIWPLGLTLVTLLSPLSWAYYFIPSVCFAAILIDRLGLRQGGIVLLASLTLLAIPVVRIYRTYPAWEDVGVFINQGAGLIAFALLCYGFWQASRDEPPTVQTLP